MKKISEILNEKCIILNSELNDKDEIIEKLVELATKSGNITNTSKVLEEVFVRENLMSTGIGNNIAIPHTKSEDIKELTAAMITLSKPVNFDSLDGKKVSIVFLILSNSEELGLHIKALSKISKILNNRSFFGDILNVSKNAEVIELFDNFEN
ncbi:MAG: PTS sugar transporter subunit IIA [Ignavibacteriae bacterium HGW-Ignavibacteriae-4]|jgi:fructose-specific phosphotransferase system IIA component|nr:MAG: PTS sugar transporter subunit IIA [Ignavibacteriae bacterium HGW-Ignavibacteriae-4]